MKIACIIPARLKSSRFPRKILAPLAGKPLIQHVWEAANETSLFDSVTVAVDADETAEMVKSFGGSFLMTRPECPSGTYRLSEVVRAHDIGADLVVCWQGDEPLIHRAMINDLLQSVGKDAADVWTLKKKITDPSSPHIAKVVTDQSGYALYFSRSPIPYFRDDQEKVYFKHIGIYAYRTETLRKISELPVSPLEIAEQLEQLTFLYHGLKIRVHETSHEVVGIDIPEHLAHAEHLLHPFGTLTTNS